MAHLPVSTPRNRFFNGESIDNSDLTLEQDHNEAIQSATIANHMGSGVIREDLVPRTIFDSLLATGFLDGKALDPQAPTTDTNFGNQLEITLTDSKVASKRNIKVLIVGLDFQSNLQYDTLTFHRNESQVTAKHYAKVLKILFNDFIGDPAQSLNLGGHLTIKEARAVILSRDCIMVAQDQQPNIFFRDFFVATGSVTINHLLTTALPSYNIDNLEIAAGFNQLRGINPNDVSSQLGQKFQATTNNIQKITALLAVSNSIDTDDLEWTGDLIVSIYQLQSSVDCPLDIAPGTAIDFDPSNIPVAQLSLNFTSLQSTGIVLSETPQPVDFIFSNTPVGSGALIKSGAYYAWTIKRAGSADKCIIKVATGTDRTPNSKITIFNGAIWVDIADEDFWFQVWTDSAKVSDGQAYDAGHGIVIPKTDINATTGLTEDYVLDNIPFVRNDIYYAIAEAATEQSVLVQDQRTGEKVFSQQEFVPKVELVIASDLTSRETAADPLVIGSIADKNLKALSAGTSTVQSNFHHFSMIGNQCILKVIDDPTDGYRYDLSVINLVAELTGSGGISNVNGLIYGKLTPNNGDPNTFFRISDTELISMIYGDINGDGIVDELDLIELENLIGSDLNTVPSAADYTTLTTPFTSDTGLTWQFLDSDGVTVLDSGADGQLTENPQDPALAVFTSPTVAFNAVLSLDTKKIKIIGDISNPGNNGAFFITGLVNNTTVDIRKMYYTSDTILQILRADINGDMVVNSADLALITNYIEKVAPFPNTTSPANKIGTSFNAIRFTVEEYVDRADEYTASSTRATDIHILPDIITDGYLGGFPLYGRNLKTSPLAFTVNKQLTWYEYLVSANSNPKLVPSSFNAQSGFILNECSIQGVLDDHYPLPPAFDPGKNDIFFPSNLILNDGGNILRPDGYFAKLDFEVHTVIMEVPAVNFSTEKTLNIFTDLIADYSGTGRTRLGYAAARFSDCSTVPLNALTNQQVRFSISMRSFSPQLNGTDIDGYSGVIVDGRLGLSFDADSGLLTLNFTNLYEDPIVQTFKTRIQITAYLKRGGFNNQQLIIGSTQTKNLLGL